MNKLNDLIIGIIGVGGIQVVGQIRISEMITVVCTLVVTACTIYKLVKPSGNKKDLDCV